MVVGEDSRLHTHTHFMEGVKEIGGSSFAQ